MLSTAANASTSPRSAIPHLHSSYAIAESDEEEEQQHTSNQQRIIARHSHQISDSNDSTPEDNISARNVAGNPGATALIPPAEQLLDVQEIKLNNEPPPEENPAHALDSANSTTDMSNIVYLSGDLNQTDDTAISQLDANYIATISIPLTINSRRDQESAQQTLSENDSSTNTLSNHQITAENCPSDPPPTSLPPKSSIFLSSEAFIVVSMIYWPSR
jgi:hypothetical protein